VLIAGVVAFAATAGAQTPPGGAQAGGGAGGSADAQVGFQRKAQLSPQEQVTQADVSIARMEQAASAVRKQLQTAREQRDVVKTLCLNDKLSQIDVAIRSGRDRKASLAAAASRNDAELSNHEFTILQVLRQRSEQLTAEANQCIGEEAAFIGETSTKQMLDPALPPPAEETEFPPNETIFFTQPPQCASCNR
jgi:hypothetical protein